MSSDDVAQQDEEEELPGVADLKREVSRSSSTTQIIEEEKFIETFSKRSLEGEREYAHLRGLVDHYKHKGRWSWFLIALMAFMVGFQSLLLSLVGAGIWSFEKYSWLIPTLLVQNLAQIVGLAVFVVKSLFKDIKRD
ncbi:MAG: hypothetical protein C3F11_14955 [Methylocystaceae bacterium]|nr:MAG: hypothetical protein C3F11_14955 [Methylocystaceae bacterium]